MPFSRQKKIAMRIAPEQSCQFQHARNFCEMIRPELKPWCACNLDWVEAILQPKLVRLPAGNVLPNKTNQLHARNLLLAGIADHLQARHRQVAVF